MARKLSEQKQLEIIDEAKKNVTRWYDYFGHNITNFRDDKMFYNGTQWQDWEENNYKARSIEPLVHNLLKPVGRQIVGEAKNMQPAINLVPIDSTSANANNTRLIQNLVRYIAYGSNAANAYTTALLNQVAGGWGVIGVQTDYASPTKFDQVIKIRRFAEPQNVGFDPLARTPAKTDGEYCFCWELMHKDDFEKTYPGKKIVVGEGILGSNRTYIGIIAADSVVVFEYYRREYESAKLVQLTNGVDFKVEVLEKDVEAATEQYIQMMTEKGVSLLNVPLLVESDKRDTKITKIRCYKLTSEEVLDHYDWQSQKLPWAFVDSMSQYRDGKQFTESFIFAAKTPQQVYNYSMTEIIAGVRRARKESVFMTPKQANGFEDIYKNPDRQQGYKPYNPDPQAGAPPIVTQPETISPHWFTLAQQAREDIQRTLGIYEPNRGELPNQTSGVAIGRTIMQANLSLIQLWQNLYDGMREIGEIVLDLIPNIYDTERVVSLLDETGQQQTATLNQVQRGGMVENDVTQAAYTLEVKPVASFALQSQLEKDFMLQIMQIMPQAQSLLADKLASRLESPITPELVQRLQNLVPPAILAKEKGEQPPPPPPDPQQQAMMLQMQKLMEEIQGLRVDRQIKQEKLKTDKQKAHSDAILEANKQQIQRDQIVADTVKTQIRAAAEIGKAGLDAKSKLLTGMAALRSVQKRENKELH